MAEACDADFSKGEILKYITEKGGKVTNKDLVKHFILFLNKSENPDNAKAIFKERVNAVASIKQEEGIKYVILKKRSHDKKGKDNRDPTPTYPAHLEKNGESKKFRIGDDRNHDRSTVNGNHHSQIIHSHSMPSIMGMDSAALCTVPSFESSPTVLWSSDFPPGHVPQPPPRRKHSVKGKENSAAKYEKSMRQLSDEKMFSTSPQKEEIQEIVSPGSVKEKAQKLNRMASELDLVSKKSNDFTSLSSRRKEHRGDKCTDDDDSSSVSTMDPRRKEWVIKSAKSDYHELVRLLRDEPKLANVKDFNSYTALHWASKHGNLDVIKLIAGNHKANANARTSGGYTPLHLAAIFGREEIMEVLINTYGADANLRDHSGKRPTEYLQKNQAERFLTLFPSLRFPLSTIQSGRPEKNPNLMRMGSLNSKVKKTSVLSAGGKALTRMKSWGSADSIQDKASILMPPPKTIPKKKKSRKEYAGLSLNSRYRLGDSDSDSASGPLS